MTKLTAKVRAKVSLVTPPNVLLISVRFLVRAPSNYEASVSPSYQSGALSLVGLVEIVLSLVETFIELKYFHDVATPALLCHKEQFPSKTDIII